MYSQSNEISKTGNDQKNIYNARREENKKPEPVPPIPLVNLQLYQQPPPKRDPKEIKPSMYHQPYAPSPFVPPQMFGQTPMNYQQVLSAPIIKTYNISSKGPLDNHQRLNLIYEDVLPHIPHSGSDTMETINERITMYNFIKSSIFSNFDGSDIGLGDEQNTLLSYLKFDELNPFNTNRFSLNPYKGLPNGMLIYRSCYPIRKDPTSSYDIICSSNAMNINIRIYKLIEGSFNVNANNDNSSKMNFDEWRDIKFYEYIREDIIKKKVCPNFVNMYGYFITLNSKIDFNKVSELRDQKTKITKEQEYLFYDETVNQLSKTPILKLQQTIVKNPNAYTGKAIVTLTESPTHTLFMWATKTYSEEGITRKMINRGVHNEEIWMNVIFQLMVALHVMNIKNIFIKDFSIEHNVFIKDIKQNFNTTTYWKYIINGIEYFIPNYGYLVMIDSNFRNLDNNTANKVNIIKPKCNNVSTMFVNDNIVRKYQKSINNTIITNTVEVNLVDPNNIPPDVNTHKIDGKFLDSTSTVDSFEMFKKCMDPDIFGNDFIKSGGTPPVESVMKLLGTIKKDLNGATPSKNISDYIKDNMGYFFSNRVGTYVKESEIANIRKTSFDEMKIGDVVVHEIGPNLYKFVILCTKNNMCKIITKENNDNKDFISQEINNGSLFNYAKTETIAQTFKASGPNFNEENLIETYIVI
jgi:hypothetical protein